jgi:hypothetical protein
MNDTLVVLNWSDELERGQIIFGDKREIIFDKPKFSFEYTHIAIEPNLSLKRTGMTSSRLEDVEYMEVVDFIKTYPFENQTYFIAKKLNDEIAIYDGEVKHSDFNEETHVKTSIPAPSASSVYHIENGWIPAFGVNKNGNLVTNPKSLDELEVILWDQKDIPEQPFYEWNFETGEWFDGRTVPNEKRKAKNHLKRVYERKRTEAIDALFLPYEFESYKMAIEEAKTGGNEYIGAFLNSYGNDLTREDYVNELFEKEKEMKSKFAVINAELRGLFDSIDECETVQDVEDTMQAIQSTCCTGEPLEF